jgi:hypothetical protein
VPIFLSITLLYNPSFFIIADIKQNTWLYRHMC